MLNFRLITCTSPWFWFQLLKYLIHNFTMLHQNDQTPNKFGLGLGLLYLAPVSTIFQLYHGGQFLLVEETGVPGENHRPAASH